MFVGLRSKRKQADSVDAIWYYYSKLNSIHKLNSFSKYNIVYKKFFMQLSVKG